MARFDALPFIDSDSSRCLVQWPLREYYRWYHLFSLVYGKSITSRHPSATEAPHKETSTQGIELTSRPLSSTDTLHRTISIPGSRMSCVSKIAYAYPRELRRAQTQQTILDCGCHYRPCAYRHHVFRRHCICLRQGEIGHIDELCDTAARRCCKPP